MKESQPSIIRSNPRRLNIIAGVIIFVCSVIFGGGLVILNIPHYVKIEIEAPIAGLQRGDWYNTERTIQTWTGSKSRYYIWRRQTSARVEDFPNWESVINYFDENLRMTGWIRHQSPGFSLCRNLLSENKFLPPGENGYIAYVRDGKDPFGEELTVCIAVWPYEYAGSIQGYDIVLSTVNPSPLTIVISKFE